MKDFPNSGWAEKRLGEVITVTKTKGGSRPLPYVGLEDISSGGTGEFTGSMEPQGDKSTTFEFGPSHLLYGRLRPYLNKVYRPDFEGHCSSEIFPMLPDECLDRGYLFHWITSDQVVEKINATSTGARMPRANVKEILEFPFPLPPLEEQQRIVAILDEAFEGLARARGHAKANLQNAQELFENILTHTLRHKFEQGKDKLLGDICELAQGLAINKGTKHLLVEKSSKPLLRIKDLRNNTVEQYVAETGFPPKAAVTADDIIYTRTGQIGLVFRGFEGVLHNNCFSVRTLGDVSQEYLFWWLQEPVFKSEIISLASRAAQPDITHKLFKARSITFPNKDDQASAVELIESAYSETTKLQENYKNKIQDIDDLRQSLLQKAFAGELT